MDAWILITFAAATFQTLRFVLQKRLSARELSAAGATFARFIYSFPFALAITLTYQQMRGFDWPQMAPSFWVHGAIGGVSQILATLMTVMLLGRRNFAVGMTFKKTEVILSVIVGLLVLGDVVSWPAMGAVLVGLAGVLLLSKTSKGAGWDSTAVALGLGSGLLFAISGVTYRGATLSVISDDPFLRSSVSLALVTLFQTVAMLIWLGLRDRAQIGKVLAAWRRAGLIGVMSLFGSLSWFTAFTLQAAGLVNAVGQVELILSIFVGRVIFGERLTLREILGIATIGASVVVLVLVS
ncbi:DMT family transporter [Donghicola sp. C2-DW-16]|uniref:DMT family transporter n=1 Tax=Donghicola mangrovi TaxID=2729614 RepID=A0ABX2PHP9_9RHOB|nr:DMT family transporter [Donghicola mangrovi]NVO29020.1 DMT family transporter [Donghicola mangrovi]